MEILQQTLSVNGLRFYAYHGVEPQERVVGAWYLVDIDMELRADTAVATDNLEGTVNYASVVSVVKEEMQIPSNLLEHVAGRIARRIFDSFGQIAVLSVKISKVNPPVAAAAVSSSFKLVAKRN
ncbi:MAG: dihydroneopterin aldolase [Bacteroidaceae bacterium]|nr:dihydroneopterin aldolase [Bacteroidaceae bacterium]